MAGTVADLDAFFPGGSVRDQQVIDAAGRLNLTMVFTGVRHFRH